MSKANSVKMLYDQKEKTEDEIAKDLGISRPTCYRYLEILNAKF